MLQEFLCHLSKITLIFHSFRFKMVNLMLPVFRPEQMLLSCAYLKRRDGQ